LTKLIVAYRSFANANAPEAIQPVKHLSSFSFGNSTLVHEAVTQQSVIEDGKSYMFSFQVSTMLLAVRKSYTAEVKGKAIPLHVWTCPEGSRKLRFLDFKTIGT